MSFLFETSSTVIPVLPSGISCFSRLISSTDNPGIICPKTAFIVLITSLMISKTSSGITDGPFNLIGMLPIDKELPFENLKLKGKSTLAFIKPMLRLSIIHKLYRPKIYRLLKISLYTLLEQPFEICFCVSLEKIKEVDCFIAYFFATRNSSIAF